MLHCGCRVVQGRNASSDGMESPPDISFCPVHGKAKELLALLQELDKAPESAALPLKLRAKLRALIWEIVPVPTAHPIPGFIYAAGGRDRGLVTGGTRQCGLEGCKGPLIGVRWPDGKMTWPCREGMFERPDGALEIREVRAHA